MNIFKKKSLPVPTGPYTVSCVDLMTDYSPEGIFIRLFYPAAPSSHVPGIPWIPHDRYVKGLAFVVSLWVFVIRLVMWWYGGYMHIPVLWEAKLLPANQRANKKLPVIIFSHGFGATRFLCSATLTELASQGYVVASLEHRDTSACATYYYQSPGDRDVDKRKWIPHTRLELGSKHYGLRNRQVKQRRDECIRALDVLEELNNGNTSSNILNISLDIMDFQGQLDLDHVTIMGHSFGGATSLLALSSDSRFKQGVILDGWMFPLKDEDLVVSQPLLFINTPTFHISSNLSVMDKFVKNPSGAHRKLCIIRNSTHETQTDTPFVLGYWLDLFKPKIDPSLGTLINNSLIIAFLQPYTGTPESDELASQTVRNYSRLIIEGRTPSPVPVRKNLSFFSIFTLLLP